MSKPKPLKPGDAIASPPDTLEVALSLAAAGWYVFPVKLVVVAKPDGSIAVDKRPLIKWHEGASNEAEAIATWWGGEFPGAWIGVHCERSGIVVADLDLDKPYPKGHPLEGERKGTGADNLKAAGIKPPKTFKYKTRSGGKHLVYRAPKGRTLTIGADVPVPGVDIRAGTGLMVYYGPRLDGPPELAKAPKWALIDRTTTAGGTKHDLDIDTWLEHQRDGKAPKPLRRLVADADYAELKHEPMLTLVNELVRAGAGGAKGIAPLLEVARDRYIEGRPDRARDWDNALAGSVRHFGKALTTFKLPKREVERIAAETAEVASLPKELRLNAWAPRGIEDNPLAVELAEVLEPEWAYTEATELLRWTGKVWERTKPMALVEVVREHLRRIEEEEQAKVDHWRDEAKAKKRREKLPSLLSARKAKDVATLITGILASAGLEVDAHPDLINTQSGVVDARTLEVRPHDPKLMLTKIAGASYNPDADAADWRKALNALPPRVAQWLQVRLGQGLTGHMTPDDKLVILGGSGENGKSTLIDATRVAGGDYVVTVPERLLMANPGDHPTELTTLMGARLAVIEELPEGRNLNVKRLKDAIGTPVMTARRIRADNITWRATHSLMVTTNYRPIVAETDHGTWRRLLYVLFPYRFVGPDAELGPRDRRGDEGLRRRLGAAPSDAVLTWLIEGAHRWYSEGMPKVPKVVKADTLEWREEADPVLAYFQERLVRDAGYAIPAADLAEDFNSWLTGRNHNPWSLQTINARFAGHEVMAEVERRKVSFGKSLLPSRVPAFHIKPVPPNAMGWVGVRFVTEAAVPPSGEFADVVRGYNDD